MAPDRIVGLIPKVDAISDPDMQQALIERQAVIEQGACELSQPAVRSRQPWAVQLGTPPTDPVRREHWYRQLDTITTYRKRWNITGPNILGHESTGSLERQTQQQLAEAAIGTALQLRLQHREHRQAGQSGPTPAHQLSRTLEL